MTIYEKIFNRKLQKSHKISLCKSIVFKSEKEKRERGRERE